MQGEGQQGKLRAVLTVPRESQPGPTAQRRHQQSPLGVLEGFGLLKGVLAADHCWGGERTALVMVLELCLLRQPQVKGDPSNRSRPGGILLWGRQVCVPTDSVVFLSRWTPSPDVQVRSQSWHSSQWTCRGQGACCLVAPGSQGRQRWGSGGENKAFPDRGPSSAGGIPQRRASWEPPSPGTGLVALGRPGYRAE